MKSRVSFLRAICKEVFLYHGILSKPLRIFHILDSLPDNSTGVKETNQLQRIFLNHFEGAAFKRHHITTNIAQVIPLVSLPSVISSNHSGALPNK